MRTSLLALVVGATCLGTCAGCCWSVPKWGGTSPHFDGERFSNDPPIERSTVGDFLKWRAQRDHGPWQKWTESPAGAAPPRRVGPGELRVTFVNHATVLIQLDGLNFLTDPIWSERASPLTWIGPRRHRAPGLRFEALPPIDAILISHNHYDHLDLATLHRLSKAHQPRIFVPLGNRALLERHGLTGAEELDWWQGVRLPAGIEVSAVPAQHFSGRSLTDRDRAFWAGYVIRSPAGAVYFAGDTGYGRHFSAIRRRVGPIRLALLPIGAFRPRWLMHPIHLAPEEALRAARDLVATTSVAIHFGTFDLADDSESEAPALLAKAVAASKSPPPFWVLGFGEGRDVPCLPKQEARPAASRE